MQRALALVWLLLLGALALAQDPAGVEVLELRVTGARPGVVDVDRGSLDGLAVGDRVRFAPRDGAALEGLVESAEERTAVVTLDDARAVLAAGTRGEARIPASRAATPEPSPTPRKRKSTAQQKPWRNRDEEYQPNQPLLTRVRPLRPEERPSRITGRWYAIADHIQSSEDERADSFARAGLALDGENLLGHGERLRIDGEFNWRRTDVPDDGDETLTRGRLDRMSYSIGGTRFDSTRLEFGRFLQSGMPEFGVLDGIEWSARADDGTRVGASLGFMPEPDPEQSTGDDFQAAAFYRWSSDPSERWTIATGYQKSLHELDADRDLFVLDVRGTNESSWRISGTAWLDYYTASDRGKSEGLEPTQVLASAGRHWDGGSSLDLTYTHFAYPELERDEFGFWSSSALSDAHHDRIALASRYVLGRAWTLRSRLGGWVDQDQSGGDGELGLDARELFGLGSTLRVAGFGTQGRFETEVGGRLGLELADDGGAWQVEYELSDHRIDGFTGDNNDLPTHRAAMWRDWHSTSGWSLSARLEAALWDDEHALTLGFYLQRSF